MVRANHHSLSHKSIHKVGEVDPPFSKEHNLHPTLLNMLKVMIGRHAQLNTLPLLWPNAMPLTTSLT
jgi:hypothetical protein